MHICPECGKSMATAGGLEIHVELFHAPPPSEPLPDIEETGIDLEPVGSEPQPVPAPAAVPATSSSSALRGYDPTVPLTALLVLIMLLVGIGAAINRSGNPTGLAPVLHAPAISASSPAGSPAAIPPAGSQPPAATQVATSF